MRKRVSVSGLIDAFAAVLMTVAIVIEMVVLYEVVGLIGHKVIADRVVTSVAVVADSVQGGSR